ncbi:hypothetical protein DL765_000348 [Monosporascus sp. GIB2]|nr:hypothetical protein DL765_000348 [Monosporascus sp. GIB2]
MGLSVAYGELMLDEQGLSVLDHAHKRGQMFWDTSDFYGDAEDVLGSLPNPASAPASFLATNFGGILTEDLWPGPMASVVMRNMSTRLATRGPRDKNAGCFGGACAVHPISAAQKHVTARASRADCAISFVRQITPRGVVINTRPPQWEYNPFSTGIEDPKISLLQACRELGVALVAYSPLSRNLLSGQIRGPEDFGAADVRSAYPHFSPENLPIPG